MGDQGTTPPSTPPPQAAYVLQRNYAASSRLNYQHYLWKASLPFILHPSIPPPSFLSSPASRVADIATGTGIWLQDLSHMVSSSVRLDGFDISLEQCPPSAWLPQNICFRQWDMFSEVPEELVGQYDIVHIRLLVYVIKPSNLHTFVKNMSKLLKPGGWLQWEDLWPGGLYVLHSSPPSLPPPPTPEMDAKIVEINSALPDWVQSIPSVLETNGFQDVEKEHYEDPAEFARAYFEMGLVKDEEIAEVVYGGRDTEKGRAALEQIVRLWTESRQDEGRGNSCALLCPKVMIVAQKCFE